MLGLWLCFVAVASGAKRPTLFSSSFVEPLPQPGPVLPPIDSGAGPNDCIVQPGQWSACSKSCGGGRRTRQPVIVRPATGYGKKCPEIHEEAENCNQQPCPIDCEVEQGQYSSCSATCGSGFLTKIDVIIREPKHGGHPCPPDSSLITRIPCPNLPPCPIPVDCKIGYTQYGECSSPCQGGTHSRSAFIVQRPQNGGAPCPDLSKLVDTKPCNEEIPCRQPTPCEYMEGNFGSCSATCGYGVRTKQIYIIAQPTEGGTPCPTKLVETQPCNAGPCPVPPKPVHCEVQWQPFGYCSKSCDGGIQTSTGTIVKRPNHSGAPCPSYGELRRQRSCNTHPCKQIIEVDCQIEYGEYSICSKSCGGGFQYRKGYIVRQPENGGLQCPAPSTLIERIPCNGFPCPSKVDCQVRRSYWSECGPSCTQTRTVTILAPAQNGGIPCPPAGVETRRCTGGACQQLPPQPRYRF